MYLLAIIAIALDGEENEVQKRKWLRKDSMKRQNVKEYSVLYKKLLDDDTKFFEYIRIIPKFF